MSEIRSFTLRSPDASTPPSPSRFRTTWDAPGSRITLVTSQAAPSTSKRSRTRAVPIPEAISFLVSLPIWGVLPYRA